MYSFNQQSHRLIQILLSIIVFLKAYYQVLVLQEISITDYNQDLNST
jgi:hypothetical protein